MRAKHKEDCWDCPPPPDAYEMRVRALEAEGLTRSDAQSVADVEDERDSYMYAESQGARRDLERPQYQIVPRHRLIVSNADGSEEEIVDDNLNLVEFLQVNGDADFTGAEIVSILTLQPGASWTGGGGAAPLYRIERVR